MVRHLGNRRPHRSSLSWTEEHIDDLRALAEAKVDPQLIARLLHRSEVAVRSFAKKHGIRLLTEAEARKRRKRKQEDR